MMSRTLEPYTQTYATENRESRNSKMALQYPISAKQRDSGLTKAVEPWYHTLQVMLANNFLGGNFASHVCAGLGVIAIHKAKFNCYRKASLALPKLTAKSRERCSCLRRAASRRRWRGSPVQRGRVKTNGTQTNNVKLSPYQTPSCILKPRASITSMDASSYSLTASFVPHLRQSVANTFSGLSHFRLSITDFFRLCLGGASRLLRCPVPGISATMAM
jgi:hypothetical protein